MKSVKKIFCAVILFSILGGAFLYSHAIAGSSCSGSDFSAFPYGFLCHSDPNDVSNMSLSGWNGTPDAKGYDGGGGNGLYYPITNGQTHFEFITGWLSGTGPTKSDMSNPKVLTWVTIDMNDIHYVSNSLSGVSGTAQGSQPGIPDNCPVSGNASSAYKYNAVYNYTADDSQKYYGTANEASPAGYDPSTGKGKEDCLTQGKMIYWYENGTSGQEGRNYVLKFDVQPNQTMKFCIRESVSVQYSQDGTRLFPPTGSTNPNNVANHVAKQSWKECYEITQPPPPPPPAGCVKFPSTSTTYTLDARAIYRFTLFPMDANYISSLPSPTTYNGAVPYNMWAGMSAPGLPGGGSAPGALYQGVVQTAQTSWPYPSTSPTRGATGDFVDSSGIATASYVASSRSYRLDFGPATGGPDRFLYIEEWLHYDSNGDGVVNSSDASTYKIVTTGQDNCYTAACSLWVDGDPALGGAGVMAGQTFSAHATLTNTGTGGQYLPGSLYSAKLGITGTGTWTGVIANVPDNSNPPTGWVGPGWTVQMDFQLTAPNSVNNYTLGGYPDYYGVMSLWGQRPNGSTYGSPCNNVNVPTYQGFQLTPHADTPGGDSEDPSTINYHTWVTSGGTSAVVPMNTYSYFSRQICGAGEIRNPSVSGTVNYNPNTDTNVVGPGTYTVSCSVNAGDKFCDYIQIDYTTGYIGPGGAVIPTGSAGNTVGPNCLTIANKPYFKVFGSGISAGGHFNASGGACSSGATAGNLAGWNNNSTSNANFGSSAALHTILFGNNTIKGVASGQSPTAFGASASTLSFANVAGTVDATAPSPNIGGKFGSTHCFTELPQHSPSTDPGANTSVAALVSATAAPGKGYFAHTGSKTTLGGGTIGTGQNISLYTDQDVYITGNITYQLSGWTKDTVPSFVLHTTGNIYIDRSVTNLDGIFVSETTTPGGHIYTCGAGTAPYADGSVPADPFTPMAKNELYANCNKQLVVHGSFVADNVDLMRTYGSLRNEKPTVSGGVQQPITMSKTMKGATPCVSVKDSFSKLVYGCSVDPSLRVVTASTKPPNLYCVWPRSFDSAVPSKYWFCENLATPSVTPKVVAAAGDCSNSNGITPTHNTCAAEVFEFSPELYLSQPAIQTQNLGAGSWNAVTSLPPVL